MDHFVISNDLIQIVTTVVLLAVVCIVIGLIATTRRRRKSRKSRSKQIPEARTQIVPEIFIDLEGFTLMGPDWTWLRDEPASYGCRVCGQSEPIKLRLYKYAYGNKVFIVSCHNCQRSSADLHTEPITPVVMVPNAGRRIS